eukprot:1582606-Prymnesium_polylepis.1
MPLAGGSPVHSSARLRSHATTPAGKGGRRRRLEEAGARSHARRTGQHKRRGSTKDVLEKVQPTGLARDAFEGRERAV